MQVDTTSRRRRHRYISAMAVLAMSGCSAMDQRSPVQPAALPERSSAAAPAEEGSQRWSANYAAAEQGEQGDPAEESAGSASGSAEIQQVSTQELAESFDSPDSQSATPKPVRLAVQQQLSVPDPHRAHTEGDQPLPKPEPASADRYPIDLATALQLAGANNLQIAVAAEQVRESAARLARAEVMWVPSLNFGVGYNRHDGQIQATEGDVVEVSRSSAFVGGGPTLGSAPLTGLGGTPRLFVGLNPAEAYFEPLAERCSLQAASAERSVTFNDTLLEVGLAYYDLTAAQMRIAIAEETVQNAQQLVRLAEDFERAGAGLAADTARARAQLASARMQRLEANEELRVTSAELARLLRLDSDVVLYPAETVPIPVELVSTETPLAELVAQGLGRRPELAQRRALVAEAQSRLRLERWRPWVPNIQLGNSAGGYGGGRNDFIGNFEGRNDFDALAVWEVESFGLGNRARLNERASQRRQEHLRMHATVDRIAAEIAQAYARAKTTAEQLDVAKTLVKEASRALPLNLRAIRGGQLSPIEAQQAIDQLADARRQYLSTVIEYDRAQLQLLRAIGNPPDEATAHTPGSAPSADILPTPPELVDVPVDPAVPSPPSL